jgi:hypothetical protein
VLILDAEYMTFGTAGHLDRPNAVILNSRQSKTPVGDDLWVQNTLKAVTDVRENGQVLICSVGMNTWEFALYAVSEAGVMCIVLLPEDKNISLRDSVETIARDFSLDPESHLWISIPAGTGKGRKGWWDHRDSLAFDMADTVYPVSIRADGRWDKLLASGGQSKHINDAFRADYVKSKKSIPILPKGLEVKPISPWPYITHWTRRFYGPWPGETSFEYYRSIVESGNVYSHSAAESLRRILIDRKIRGSSLRIRGGEKAVAFTALAPDEAVPLMKWRPRYVRPTFEPFGIAINTKAARKAGILPVEYLPDGLESHATPRALQQGFGRGDWPVESEWRAIGDVDLSRFRPEDIRIIVPLIEDRENLQHSTNFTVISLNEIK